MENIVINFEVNNKDLVSTIDLLVKLGKITEADAEQFKKLGASTAAFNKPLTETEKALNQIAIQGQKTNEILGNLGKNTKNAANEAKSGLKEFGDSLKTIGAQIGIAFGVSEIIRFGKEAVNAYAESEKAQLQLLNALKGQGDVQQRLIKQSDELQGKFGIDNDAIVKQQAFLALQGRTEEQITKTINAAIQLSAVTGEDLASSVQKLDATFEGSVGKLGKLDNKFNDLSKSELANGAAIDLINEKYKGFAEAGAASVSGQLEIQQRKVDDLVKALGERLAPSFVQFKIDALQSISDLFDGAAALFDKNKSILNPANWFGLNKAENERERISNLLKAETEKSLVALEGLNKKKLANIILADLEELKSNKNLSEQKMLLLKGEIAAAGQLLRAKKDVTNEDVKQVDTLEELNDKLAKLKTKQLKVTAGVDAEALIKEIAATQAKIDEITGKGREERKNKELQDAQELAKQKTDIAKRAGDEEFAFQMSLLDGQQAVELAQYDLNEQEKLAIQIKYAEKRKELIFTTGFDKNALQKANDEIALLNAKLQAQVQKDGADTTEALAKQAEERKNKAIKEFTEAEIKKREEAAATLEYIASMAQQIAAIFTGLSDARISELEDQRDAVAEADNAEIAALKDKLDRRLISQKTYEIELKKLEDKKQADTKKFEAQITEEKRKQALLNRELALFNIAINTATAITKLPAEGGLLGIAAIPLMIALGIAQAAAVLAAPLPKFHKGRLAQLDSGEQHAIIRKDETIFDPVQSKEYAPTFAAIYNGKIKPNVINDYVSLKLKGGNVSSTIDTHRLAYDIAFAMRDQNKVYVKNMPELAKAIADNLPKPDPRKW